MVMNILIVSLFPLERNTSVANSSISIINGILELNHQVTIVMPNWPKNETGCDLSKLRVIRIPGQPDYLYSSMSKIIGKIHSHFDVLDVSRGYLRTLKDVIIPDEFYDVVLSLSDPKVSHIYAARLISEKKLRYGRFIQHWGDPITGDFTRHYWWPEFVIKWYERSFIRRADKSVYVTPFTYEMIKSEHPTLASKVAFAPLPAEMIQMTEFSESTELRLSYLGDYNPSIRNLRPLYDACANRERIRLVMAGNGPTYPKCSNVSQLPRIPQQQAQQIENESDVLVCVCNVTGTMIPGKIMYKASSNKHILVALEDDNYDDMKAYFESYDRYVICRNTSESIAEALESLREKKSEYKTPDRLLPINVAREILK